MRALVLAAALCPALASAALAQPEKEPDPPAGPAEAAGGLACCGLSLGALVAAAVAGLVINLIPTIIAVKRRHPDTAAIVAVNLLLGWTLIGWVVALVWSLRGPAAGASPR